MTSAPHEQDPGEQVQRAIERVTGTRGEGCPWAALSDPYVQRVISGHRHWGHGELSARYGGEVPEALWRGVEVFDQALSAIDRFDSLEAMKPRDPPPTAAPRRGVQFVPASKLPRRRLST